MGVTDVRSITVDGVKDFKARLVSEERARRNWAGKWGWILEEHKKVNEQLKSLKTRRTHDAEYVKKPDSRTTLPIPDTVNHEYGWLASRAEFKLERYPSPGLAKIPREIPLSHIWAILDHHLGRSYNLI